MWRKTFDVLFWLGVSAYFGGMLTVGAIVAPAVFRTAETTKMSMPGIVSPPLEMDRQVGGEIFGAVLNRFAAVEMAAMCILLVAILGWMLSHRTVRRSTWLIAVLWALLAAVGLYDTYGVRSKVWQTREDVRKSAPEYVAVPKAEWGTKWPEWTAFDALHKRSEAVGRWKVYILFAMLLAASWRGLAEKKQSGGFRRMRVMTPVP